MIRFPCASCGASLKAMDNAAGKPGKCPTCGAPFTVPAGGAAPSAASASPAAPARPPADLVRVVCPHCGIALHTRAAAAVPGNRATCAACKNAFTIPAVPAPAPAPRPAPAASRPRPRPAAAPAPAAQPPQPREVPAQPAPAEAPRDDSTEELVGYPWDPPAELVARAEAFDQRNEFHPFTVKVNEFLNGLLKAETFKTLLEAELRIYPDMVGITERPPGCLARLIMGLPGPIQSILYWTLGGGLLGLLFLPFTLLVLVFTSPIWVPMMIIDKLRIAYAARHIRRDPRSSYAIRKLHQYAPVGPRYWQRGDVAQIIRVDTRRRLLKRSLVLFVLDNPLPAGLGCLRMGLFLVVGRMFQGLRRIYVVDVEGGPEQADAAAAAAAGLLQVPVDQGKFTLGNLSMKSA